MPNSVDIAIITLVNSHLKECATSSARSATEASNPGIHQTLVQMCQESIQSQAEVAQVMEQKGWYQPPSMDHSDIQQLLPQLNAVLSGIPQAAGASPAAGAAPITGMARGMTPPAQP